MSETISFATLAPREQSIVDAFAKGACWSEAYFETWLQDRPALMRQMKRFALDTPVPPPATISAALIRHALLSKIAAEDGTALRIDERGARLHGVTVDGPLDLTALEFCKPIAFENCIFNDTITLLDAKLGHVSFNGCSVPHIDANLVDIESDFSLDGLRDCRTISLRAARIRGSLRLQQATLTGGEGRTLNCRGAEIGGSVWLRFGFRAAGAVNFVGAKIGGRIDCRDGHFRAHSGRAFDCHAATIGGSVFMSSDFSADGEVNFVGASIKGDFECQSGRFSYPENKALNCKAAMIGGSVYLCHGFNADGEVNFVGAKVARDFECQEGSFLGHGSHDALDLEEVHIEGTLYLTKVSSFRGRLDLQDAFATSLADDGSVWNGQGGKAKAGYAELYLDRFRYNSFANDYGEHHDTALDSASRLAWLLKQPKGWCDEALRPQPFTQCARVLHGMGHTRHARRILYERENRRLKRADIRPVDWIVGTLLRIVAGHGYKTRRAIYILIAIWLAGALIFGLAFRNGQMRVASEPVLASETYRLTGKPPDDYERFKPIVYSADVLVPIIDLGQHRYWAPRDASEIPLYNDLSWSLHDWRLWLWNAAIWLFCWLPKLYYWFAIITGWFLSTIAIAGFTGVLGPERDD